MDIESARAGSRPRRAEVLAALSTAIDIGLGQPMDHMLSTAVFESLDPTRHVTEIAVSRSAT